MPHIKSTLISFDLGGGYRQFLGADPTSAFKLQSYCNKTVEITREGSQIKFFHISKSTNINDTTNGQPLLFHQPNVNFHNKFTFPENRIRYFPEMLDWVVSKIEDLIRNGIKKNQIVILAPILSDMLLVSLTSRLTKKKIKFRTSRPSRSFTNEPSGKCLITLTRLAHPNWKSLPTKLEVIHTLVHAIEGLDLVRSHLLVESLYQINNEDICLLPYSCLDSMIKDRIPKNLGENYDRLITWINGYNDGPELDIFLSRLFGEILSQPGFRFHSDQDSCRITQNLITSMKKFRQINIGNLFVNEDILAREFFKMIADGVIFSTYEETETESDSLFILPAYSFIMRDQVIDYQFWINVSEPTWYERIDQPLTHPIVLSNNWKSGDKWTSENEINLSKITLDRILYGLIQRCGKKIFVGLSTLNENGIEQKGLMLRTLQSKLAKEKTLFENE